MSKLIKLNLAPEVEGLVLILGAKWGIGEGDIFRRALALLDVYSNLKQHEKLAIYNTKTKSITSLNPHWDDGGTGL